MHSESYTYLALGDSYTIGEGVQESERWPIQLVQALRRTIRRVADPVIVAQTGWTTGELAQGILQAGLAPRPRPFDLVSLLIGVNNQYRGQKVEEYLLELRSLLAQASKFAGDCPDRVIVLSIPDWSVTPFAAGRPRHQISAEIDRFNQANREIARKSGAHYRDITPISRRAAAEPELIAADGLHPSAKMYAAWVAFILPTVCKMIDQHPLVNQPL